MTNNNYLKQLRTWRTRFATFLLALITLAVVSTGAQAQSTIISPTVNNGGFESGATGWTTVNGSQANKWQISTTATAGFSGTTCAYISQTAASPFAHTYNVNSSSVTQIYRDFTVPAGETSGGREVLLACHHRRRGEADGGTVAGAAGRVGLAARA